MRISKGNALGHPRSGTSVTKATVVRIAMVYVVLVGIWVFMQSGIPFSIALRQKIDNSAWLQTINGAFFVIASGWLLYLLIARMLDSARLAEAQIRIRDRAIEASVDAIVICDHLLPDRPIVYVNRAFELMTGYSSDQVKGRNPRFLQGEETDQANLLQIRSALKEGQSCKTVLRNYRKDGTLYWNELSLSPVRDTDGRITHYIGVQSDVTKVKQQQEELTRQATHDALTGLPNRLLLMDRIASACSRADRYGKCAAIVFIDLDNFKRVNDSAGHVVGDELLKAVSQRVLSSLRAIDSVARLGGDEFVALLVDQDGEHAIGREMQRIVDAFSKPFEIGEREFFVTASVGVALYPTDSRDGMSLLKSAELAMYKAKEIGKNNFQTFTSEMNARVTERALLEDKLRRAIERDELVLHYQPQVDLRTNRILGAEALLRWKHPELGLVSPARFIPLAEDTGMIVPIGEWVLRTACAENKAWRDAGLPQITVAVNISARQFREKSLTERIRAILAETGLDPQGLELEVTESVIMHDAQHVISTLRALKDLGIQLSIDDFGTGYSSLAYLKRFPVDRLKIDQSFVRDITSDTNDAAIARAVITLGQTMHLKVIAEGVETQEQLAFLRANECDEIQGYLFSKPVTAIEFICLLKEDRRLMV